MKLTILSFLFIAACASTPSETQIADKIAAQKDVADSSTLLTKVHTTIDQAQTLQPEQRSYIKSLVAEIKEKNAKLTEDGFKVRSLLIGQLVAKSRDQKEIAATKAQIIEIERKKVQNSFLLFDKIEEYMGNDEERNNTIRAAFELMNERGAVNRN